MKLLEGPHSPTPFRLVETPASHFILDALGDSIGALASRTGDHPAAEQLANARLFQAAPALLALVVELVLDLATAEVENEPSWACALIDPATRFNADPAGSPTERARVLIASLGPFE